MTESSTTHKVFISYSRSSPNRQEWVRHLAGKLRKCDVNVALDQWDLKAGNDIYAYMEQIVSGEDINKVIIVCDTDYAQKANSRQKGVGVETQIISTEIYNKTDQNKFIPVLAEKDSTENPSIPICCKNLLHIDLSDDNKYESNFKDLLRAIYEEPEHTKPKLGKRPDFSGEKISPVSIISSSEVCNSLRHNNNDATGILEEYFSNVTANMEQFTHQAYTENYDHIIDSINDFLPYRDEIIKILSSIAIYSPKDENINKIHKFFEKLIPYLTPRNGSGPYSESDFDNFKFIVQELFLYAIAILIKHERFEQAAYLINEPYYVKSNITNNSMFTFFCMYDYLISFHNRNNNLNLRIPSLHADTIKERIHSIITFEQMMQADFILSIKPLLTNNDRYCWYPITLIYAKHSPFEIFGRAEKKTYFDKIKCIWDIQKPSQLEAALKNLSNDHHFSNIFHLANYHKLCSIE